jgi:hypothetical protein
MITFKDFILENKQILTLYHGSDISNSRQFSNIHHNLFLSTEPNFSKEYGRYLYEVTIQPKKIFDTTSRKNKKIIKNDLLKLIQTISNKEEINETDEHFVRVCHEIITKELPKKPTWYWLEGLLDFYKLPGFGIKYFEDKGYDAILIREWDTINYIIWSNEPILNFKPAHPRHMM